MRKSAKTDPNTPDAFFVPGPVKGIHACHTDFTARWSTETRGRCSLGLFWAVMARLISCSPVIFAPELPASLTIVIQSHYASSDI